MSELEDLFTQQLTEMGFDEAMCRNAVEATGGSSFEDALALLLAAGPDSHQDSPSPTPYAEPTRSNAHAATHSHSYVQDDAMRGAPQRGTSAWPEAADAPGAPQRSRGYAPSPSSQSRFGTMDSIRGANEEDPEALPKNYVGGEASGCLVQPRRDDPTPLSDPVPAKVDPVIIRHFKNGFTIGADPKLYDPAHPEGAQIMADLQAGVVPAAIEQNLSPAQSASGSISVAVDRSHAEEDYSPAENPAPPAPSFSGVGRRMDECPMPAPANPVGRHRAVAAPAYTPAARVGGRVMPALGTEGPISVRVRLAETGQNVVLKLPVAATSSELYAAVANKAPGPRFQLLSGRPAVVLPPEGVPAASFNRQAFTQRLL
jgi:hypothetical protein